METTKDEFFESMSKRLHEPLDEIFNAANLCPMMAQQNLCQAMCVWAYRNRCPEKDLIDHVKKTFRHIQYFTSSEIVKKPES